MSIKDYVMRIKPLSLEVSFSLSINASPSEVVRYWVGKVAERANPVAQEVGIHYQPLLSPLPEGKDVPLVVINLYPLDWGAYAGEQTADSLIPAHNLLDVRAGHRTPGYEAWTEKLQRVFSTAQTEEALASALVVNAYFFAGVEASERVRSLRMVYDLIERLEPDRLIVLGQRSEQLEALGVKRVKEFVPGRPSVLEGRLYGTECLILPGLDTAYDAEALGGEYASFAVEKYLADGK